MRLNKFISNCGICSRRKADILIKKGDISINGVVVKQVGTIVNTRDEVKFKNNSLRIKNDYIYILLNKPKNYVTTCFDPYGRKTVLNLININKRIFPIGRLDRNTTGLLILTNDGNLMNKLTHPSSNIAKKYKIIVDNKINFKDEKTLKNGVNLKDGFFKFDKVYINENRREIDVEMHSGRNRIIRRVFENLGYKVEYLDRYFYAGLTYRNVEIGKYRFLGKEEVAALNCL